MSYILINDYNNGVLYKYTLLSCEVTVRESFWHASFHVE